jgi:hypothetical protein
MLLLLLPDPNTHLEISRTDPLAQPFPSVLEVCLFHPIKDQFCIMADEYSGDDKRFQYTKVGNKRRSFVQSYKIIDIMVGFWYHTKQTDE